MLLPPLPSSGLFPDGFFGEAEQWAKEQLGEGRNSINTPHYHTELSLLRAYYLLGKASEKLSEVTQQYTRATVETDERIFRGAWEAAYNAASNLESAGHRLERSCAQFFGEVGFDGRTLLTRARAEILLVQAHYAQRHAGELKQWLLQGHDPPDALTEERREFREKATHLLKENGRFFLDLGPEGHVSTEDNPETLREIMRIAEETNADIVGLLRAHRHALQNDDTVFWHQEVDVWSSWNPQEISPELEKIYREHDVPLSSEQWVTLEEWLRAK